MMLAEFSIFVFCKSMYSNENLLKTIMGVCRGWGLQLSYTTGTTHRYRQGLLDHKSLKKYTFCPVWTIFTIVLHSLFKEILAYGYENALVILY